MLEAIGLRRRFGAVRALDGFDLTVAPGEICGLIGHNGAGKTTFARIACGLDQPDEGRVLITGLPAPSRTARRRVGWAPQETALYPTATVRDNLRLFGELAGIRGARLRAGIDELAAALELTGLLGRPVRRLSGGQRRRVQTATAMLHRPPVLLLDEPTVGADPATRQALLAVVRDRAAAGAAVCYTTHYLPELVDLDATLAVAFAGRIIARGPRQDLLAGIPGRARLRFDGPAPGARGDVPDLIAAEGRLGVTVAGDVLEISAARPAEALAGILAAVGPAGARLREVEITEPTLDDLDRHLTAPVRASHAA